MDKKLVEYFEKNIEKGYTEAEIKNILLKHGFEEKELDDAIKEIGSQAESEERTHIHAIFIAIGMGAGLALLMLVLSKFGIDYLRFVQSFDKAVLPVINNIIFPVLILVVVAIGIFFKKNYGIARWNATMLSLFLPGSGQAVYKQWRKAVLIWAFILMVATVLLLLVQIGKFEAVYIYIALVVLIPLYIWNIYDAYKLGSAVQENFTQI